MLDIFMIFFAVFGFYLVITAESGMLRYCLAGLSLGLAAACKLNAALFLIPVLLVLPYERKLKEAIGLSLFAIVGYVSTYLKLLWDKGFSAVVNSQSYMLGFQFAHHVYGESLSMLMRVLTPLIVHTTTLAPTGYGGCPPHLFGLPLSTIAETVDAPLLLLLFPILYWLLRHHVSASPQRRRAIRLLIGTIISCMIYEAVFPFAIGGWYFAPLGTLLAISTPAMLKDLQESRISAYSTYAFLSLLTIWLIPANAFYLACGIA
jgi:4-amino-4-deoxy-L-arabinose transferase-like glycosyltransferase